MGSICSLNITHNTGSAPDSESLAVLLPLTALVERIVRDNPSGVWSRNSMLNSSIIRAALADDLPPKIGPDITLDCVPKKRGSEWSEGTAHETPPKLRLTSAEIWPNMSLHHVTGVSLNDIR